MLILSREIFYKICFEFQFWISCLSSADYTYKISQKFPRPLCVLFYASTKIFIFFKLIIINIRYFLTL